MPKQATLDKLYMNVAAQIASMSHARRAKVGAVIVKNDNIISMGWNGTPAGSDNNCEIEDADGTLTTKREVLHAESNALCKLVSSESSVSSTGSTLYLTLSPCFECCKLIKQTKVARVVYRDHYRDTSGIDFLKSHGVIVDNFKENDDEL
jgi:dCMP deaminase